eukprot:m.49589 g.49589  ORF g.49589 m.49589 type:complete len:111 (-) comp7132_c0_seq2:622-954(-)
MGLGILDWILIGFFASHIPITIMFDAQAILPRDLFPAATTNLLSAYAEAFHDPYMGKSPVRPWFASFVACELAFQVGPKVSLCIPAHMFSCSFVVSSVNFPKQLGFLFCA